MEAVYYSERLDTIIIMWCDNNRIYYKFSTGLPMTFRLDDSVRVARYTKILAQDYTLLGYL